MSERPMCRFGDGSLAVARFATPRGCVCYPDDREQDLCYQHVIKWGIIGDAKVLIDYMKEPDDTRA